MRTNLVSNLGVLNLSCTKTGEIPIEDKKVLMLAISNYGHVIPEDGKDYTFPEFADMIEKVYSLENQQNAEVCRVLRKWPPSEAI